MSTETEAQAGFIFIPALGLLRTSFPVTRTLSMLLLLPLPPPPSSAPSPPCANRTHGPASGLDPGASS